MRLTLLIEMILYAPERRVPNVRIGNSRRCSGWHPSHLGHARGGLLGHREERFLAFFSGVRIGVGSGNCILDQLHTQHPPAPHSLPLEQVRKPA